MSLDNVTKVLYINVMEEKKPMGRPPKYSDAMTGAERTAEWRMRKKVAERRKAVTNKDTEWFKTERKRRQTDSARRSDSEYKKLLGKAISKHPKIVKDYFVSLSEHEAFLKLAIAAADKGMFAPESRNIIEKKHNNIKLLMDDLLKLI